ncbi:hypothetical protein NST74_28800 [Paenibacillus sp. FSL F4-0125]|uniref:hypothetical protein n=1 Tax=Paenibacillus sp. FSL F4-0125 TaxID=2954730 RepID=UPI0030F5FEAB
MRWISGQSLSTGKPRGCIIKVIEKGDGMDMKWHKYITRWADSRGLGGREIDYQWPSPSFPVVSIRSNLGRYSGQGYGYGSKPQVKTAVGLIAIGDVAIGLISIGAISVGVLSVGAISLGMWLALGAIALSWLGFAAGAIAIAGVAVGAIAIAEKALGAIAIGDTAFGAIAIGRIAGGVIAIGQWAYGVIAVGEHGFGLIPITGDVWNWFRRLFGLGD